MSMYVFAPAGSEAFHNNLLKYAVEFIGSQQKGFGSSWAKGKRYLKKEVLCSGTALKRACVIKNKYVNHDFEEYGTEVYYYQTEDCARIVKTILDYIVDHKDDAALPQAFSNKSFQELFAETYDHRISQAEWVRDMDYKKQGDMLTEDTNAGSSEKEFLYREGCYYNNKSMHALYAMKSNFDKVFSYNLDEVRKKNLVDMERLFNLLSVMNEQQIRLDTAVHGINSNGIERQRELNKGYLQELKAFLTDLNTLNRKNSHSDFIWKLR